MSRQDEERKRKMFGLFAKRDTTKESPGEATDPLGAATLRAMLDQMPVNVLLADPTTGDKSA